MLERSWTKGQKALGLAKRGGGLILFAIGGLLYSAFVRGYFPPRPVLGLAIVVSAVVGVILGIVGLMGFLYHRTAGLESQLSMCIIDGPDRGTIYPLGSAIIRIGRNKEGRVQVAPANPPDDYWVIAPDKGSWWLKHVTGDLNVQINGQPAASEMVLHEGDRIRFEDVMLSFDRLDKNQSYAAS